MYVIARNEFTWYQTRRGRGHDIYAAARVIEESLVRDDRKASLTTTYSLPNRKRAEPNALR